MYPLTHRSISALVVAFLLAAPAAFAQDPEPEPPPPVEEAAMTDEATVSADIVTWLAEQGIYSQLVTALEQTGLAETLSAEGPFTLFAPTDDAFAELPEGALEAMTADELAEVLRAHVVAGAVTADELGDTITTLAGTTLPVGMASVGEATVLRADIEAANGIIHAIDTVLLPVE